MYQHIDLMAAQSMARERERLTQADLRHREASRRRAPAATMPTFAPRSRWHDLLVRVHLAHAPTH
ncbi:hypothetical protein [Ornithinimicrobium kibberense]|uniref:Uncharacterized protein n=1 Tax=Ornithinimicrobium kibberense TaxID=282060 RepID=A0ABV5UZG6_9MICO|nr:hypothetical protein [Ornithinimicrobium kibberense]